MWKRVLAIGVLFAVGLPVYGKQEGSKPKGDQGKRDHTQAPPSSTLGKVTCLIKQDGTAIECHYPQTNPQSYFSRLISPENLPNLLLFFVGLGGICVAVCTLKKLGIQTDTMKNQVGLMREQMDRMVERERARLSINIQPITILGEECWRLISCLELTNSGHSNAYIRFSAARFVIAPSGQWPLPQPEPDNFSPFCDTVEPREEPVYAPSETDYPAYTLKVFAQDIASAALSVYLYGSIEYETLGIKWHRDFGYVWTIDDSSRDTSNVIFKNPKDGEACLTGWWEQDLRQKNAEYQTNPN